MPTQTSYGATNYRDRDFLDSDLAKGGVALDVVSNADGPLNVEIGFRNAESARVLSVSGDPVRVVRGSREVGSDNADFLGVLFQRVGHTVYSERDRQRVVAPGEIIVWHGRRPLDFWMPERFRKVCLLVPIDRFVELLPEAEQYVGAHFKTGTNFAKLLGSCFTTLADNVLPNDEDPGAAVDLTLEMLGAALTKSKESRDTHPRARLFERICTFIEKRLD
jgi:hypothetical protein